MSAAQPVLVLAAVVAAIAVIAIEAIVLWRRGASLHGAAGDTGFALNLLAGACLMLALYAAVAGAEWPWILAGLAAAGLAHALDLRARWRLHRL